MLTLLKGVKFVKLVYIQFKHLTGLDLATKLLTLPKYQLVHWRVYSLSKQMTKENSSYSDLPG